MFLCNQKSFSFYRSVCFFKWFFFSFLFSQELLPHLSHRCCHLLSLKAEIILSSQTMALDRPRKQNYSKTDWWCTAYSKDFFYVAYVPYLWLAVIIYCYKLLTIFSDQDGTVINLNWTQMQDFKTYFHIL